MSHEPLFFGMLKWYGMSIEIRYVKRLEMEIDLLRCELPPLFLPEGFFWVRWNSVFIPTHAQIMHTAFCNDLDGYVFPTYRQYESCECLIRSTSSARSFAPEGTWLIGCENVTKNIPDIGVGILLDFCASIQCIRLSKRRGQIQNVSTLPKYRRLGLGRALVLKALYAFYAMKRETVTLEVTAENRGAIRMYSSLGFKPKRFFYSESFLET